MSTPPVDYTPGTILEFLHLHLDRVEDCRSKPLDNKLYHVSLSIEGTLRPMLLLWTSDNRLRPIYNVLYMTSQLNPMHDGYRVEIKTYSCVPSYVICGFPIGYNERLRAKHGRRSQIPYESWLEVLEKLPKQMRDRITEIELREKQKGIS